MQTCLQVIKKSTILWGGGWGAVCHAMMKDSRLRLAKQR